MLDKGFFDMASRVDIRVTHASALSMTTKKRVCSSHVAARSETYESRRSGNTNPLVPQIHHPHRHGVVLQQLQPLLPPH